MTTIDEFDVPLSKVEASVVAWVTEALELRHGPAEDPEGALNEAFSDLDVLNSREIVALMSRLRQRADRIDYLASLALRAKGRALRAQAEAKFAADQKYSEAMSNRSLTKREFTSGKELHANASLDSIDDRRLAHKAERLVSVTAEAYDVINQAGWQIQRMRDDLKEMLRTLRFEHSLDH